MVSSFLRISFPLSVVYTMVYFPSLFAFTIPSFSITLTSFTIVGLEYPVFLCIDIIVLGLCSVNSMYCARDQNSDAMLSPRNVRWCKLFYGIMFLLCMICIHFLSQMLCANLY